jgi:mxaJ protein
MFLRFLSAGLLCAATLLAGTQGSIRVCADPNNLPMSNHQQQGFENKIAELVAAGINRKLEYTWWSQRKSFAKRSLNAGACDVLLEVPARLPDVLTTRSYYQSTYVFVTRKDRNLHLESLADPRLADLRIGVHVVGDDYAPPAYALAHRGITKNLTGFSLFGEYGEPNPARKLIDAVERGDVDVAIVWGPFAGFFARGERAPLDIVPVTPPAFLGVPFVYPISAAVRVGNEPLKAELDRVLKSNSSAIERILAEYAVPEVH